MSWKKKLAQFPCPPRLPNAYNIRDRSRRLVLGIGLGNLTGFTGVGVVASAMRAVVIYINKVLDKAVHFYLILGLVPRCYHF